MLDDNRLSNGCDNNSARDNDEQSTTYKNEPEFYEKAKVYWSKIPSTVNGMLGGLGFINVLDIQGSQQFLKSLALPHTDSALDCGAGIGRVAKQLLLPLFQTVDLVEQNEGFATKAHDYCITDGGAASIYRNRLGTIHNVGLQNFSPQNGKYNLIWSQWVLGHLTDQDLLTFFGRVRRGLAPQGCFVFKENVSSSNAVEKDEVDSSVTRPLRDYERFVAQAQMRIVKCTKQQNFPKGLFPVYMIACQPKESK